MVTSGFGPGNVILAGDKLVVLSDAGEVALVSAQPDAYHELGRVQAIEGKCWSTPAASDGKLYIRSTTQGSCFDLETENNGRAFPRFALSTHERFRVPYRTTNRAFLIW